MTAGHARLPAPAASHLAPGRAVSRLAVRQLRLGAVLVALICGAMSALAVSQYKPISDLLDKPGLHATHGESPP